VKAALMMARLTSVKTLASFDFTFQPSLDRNRICPPHNFQNGLVS